MEKEAKYCLLCKENFAQKFSYCPICGTKLSALEINPASSSGIADTNLGKPKKNPTGMAYQITLVKEKNIRQRNLLLLGAIILMTMVALGGTIYSIFNKSLEVSAVNTEDLFAFIADIDPVSLTPAEELNKSKKKDGGGGGGRNDENPVQKGVEATQVDNPLFSPSKDYIRMTDPEIKIRAATQGKKQSPQSNEPYGLANGGLIASDGQGCCGGQGNGKGRGQGDDDGDGLGPGKNSGSGDNGDGPDGGKVRDETNLPKVKIGVTKALNIISKPRANYTDLARQNVFQGRVVLKVTFLASGGIGAISVVSGLPNGLTEQAIAAARLIKFEPAKINGSAVAVTKTIEYTFTIF